MTTGLWPGMAQQPCPALGDIQEKSPPKREFHVFLCVWITFPSHVTSPGESPEPYSWWQSSGGPGLSTAWKGTQESTGEHSLLLHPG